MSRWRVDSVGNMEHERVHSVKNMTERVFADEAGILTVLFWSCIDNGPCAIFSFEKCFRRSDKSASSGSAADLKKERQNYIDRLKQELFRVKRTWNPENFRFPFDLKT